MYDPHDHIARIEIELEELSAAANRCRKVTAIATTACIVGGLSLGLAALGLLGAVALVFGIAAVLGGLALLGSNETTRNQVLHGIREREALRVKLIDGLELRNVAHQP